MAKGEKLQEIVLAALRTALRPLVRVCIRRSVKLKDVYELLKVVFVEVAAEELETGGDVVSSSRLSVVTGVHRKDVTRIFKEKGGVRRTESLVSRVIGQWRNDARFTTKGGKPRVLSSEGLSSEFVELVRSVSGDVAPYTVLFEMERMGIVERTSHGLKLGSLLYIAPEGDVEDAFSMLGEDMEDLASAVQENIFERQSTPNLHIKTEFNNITPDAVREIREWFYEEGSAFHRRAEHFLSRFDRDVNQSLKGRKKGVRVAYGSFSFVDSEKAN